MKLFKLFENFIHHDDYKEIAIYFLDNIDTNKKSQTIKYKGFSFNIKRKKGYKPEYYIDDEELEIFSISELFRDENIENIVDLLIKIEENKEYRKDKKTYTTSELRYFVEDILKDNGIDYEIVNALSSSVYIKTNKGTIRISDHTGQFRQYNDVIKYLFPNEYYNPSELKKEIIDLFNK